MWNPFAGVTSGKDNDSMTIAACFASGKICRQLGWKKLLATFSWEGAVVAFCVWAGETPAHFINPC